MKNVTIDFGIDLGTTNSTIARLNGLDAEVFKNNDGNEFTPSAVWIDKKEAEHVGLRAKGHLEDDVENAFSEFKLQMGSNAKYTFARNGKSYSPEELSAMVLKALKNDVRRQLGEDITSVVITVPAAFELPQCSATNKAAEMAGFINHPLLQEPIAAAMAYGFQSESNNKFWLVYDFGGGTFDAAIIRIKDGQIEVVHHGGDNGLGGKNLDWEIVNKLLVPSVIKEFKLRDFARDNKLYLGAFAKLKAEAEKAKIRLSLEDSIEITIDNLYKNSNGEAVEFICEVSRTDFERLAKPFIVRSINICKQVLLEKRLGTANIEKIIMVGGTSMIPYLREMLADPNEGLGIPLEYSIYPITVVAKGAAIFAGTQIIPVNKDTKTEKNELLLELDYQPVGSDTEPFIGGKIISDGLTKFSGFTIEFVNKTTRPEWRSGKIHISEEGDFFSQLWAEKGKKNEFLIELFNNTGIRQKTNPEALSYTTGIVSADFPLIHSIGIAMANNETDFLLSKGVSLPAKNMSVHRNLNEVRAGQKEDLLHIPIVEGENSRHADHNRLIGSLSIPGNKIRRTLPAGSEIEITIMVDKSRLVKAKAYIPVLDEEFEVEANLVIEPAKVKDLKADFAKDKELYDKLYEKSRTEKDLKALSIFGQMDKENVLEEIETLIEAAKVDPDARIKANNRILDLKSWLDQVEDSLAWPTLVNEAIAFKEDARRIADSYGDAADKQNLTRLEREIDKAIASKDPDLLRRRIDETDILYFTMLHKLPEYWILRLSNLKEKKHDMKDGSRADELISSGERAIQNNDIDTLKTVVRGLGELLPVGEQGENNRFGGTTLR